MRLRNVLIAVNDMDRAIRFYKELFGLQVILDQGGNVIRPRDWYCRMPGFGSSF